MILKKTLFETTGSKLLYYREALNRDAWSLYDAVCIVSGNVPIPNLTPEEMLSAYPLTANLFDQAIESHVVGTLKGGQINGRYYVTPKDFLLWLRKKNWSLPEELIEVLADKKIIYRSESDKDTIAYHKQKFQGLAKRLAIEIGRFNQAEILRQDEIKEYLGNLKDPFGAKRTFAPPTLRRWLSEIDDRPVNERRGRPKKSNNG